MLALRNITKFYTGTVALRDVSLTVQRGEVHGLIGKNGAGKSTLVGIVSGLIEPSSGEIELEGETFRALTPHLARQRHVAIITQEPQVIEESTVAENLFFPGYIDGKGLIDWKKLALRAEEILQRAGLPMDPMMKVSGLTVSERQMLLVIRACYVENAGIIIMDEVSASLTMRDQELLYRIIRQMTDAGKTILFISHHTRELLRVCDVVTVIRDGRNVGSFRREELDLQRLAGLIVGNDAFETESRNEPAACITGEELLSLENYTSYGKFYGVSLQLRRGEIVGLAGLRGSGRTELFRSMIGADPHDSGIMRLEGRNVQFRSPWDAARNGVVYLTEEREAEGLVPIASVRRNITMSILSKISRFGIIRTAKERVIAENRVRRTDIKIVSDGQEINQLSGGNKQKVLVARVMEQHPKICLLDEPTRGVDIEAKDSILQSIRQGFRESSGVLITSPGVEDLMAICDRILILYEGRITDSFQRSEFSEEAIYRAMQGEVIHGKEADL